MNAVISWSGGKDCCLAYYKALSQGIDISYMLNFIREDGSMTRSHHLPPEIITFQAQELGLSLIQSKVNWDNYEQGFREALLELKSRGVDTLINGDIDLPEGVAWNQKMCSELGIQLVMPLQQISPLRLLCDFVYEGFRALIVCVNTRTPARDWLGVEIDKDFVWKVNAMTGIHPCGELGEYHTLVTDGPIFSKKIALIQSKPVHIEGYSYLDILRYELKDKEQ